MAGVKVVGDYVDNFKKGLPSELAVLNLFDPRAGVPRAILNACADHRYPHRAPRGGDQRQVSCAQDFQDPRPCRGA